MPRRRFQLQPVVPRSRWYLWVLLWLSLAVLAVTLPKVILAEARYEMPAVSPAGDVAAAEARLAAAPAPDLESAAETYRSWEPRWEPMEGLDAPRFTRPGSASSRVIATRQVPPSRSPVRHPAPASLSLPALGVEAPVVPVGIDEMTRLMDIPRSASEVAWYEPGPSPGDSGSAVLAAHVDWGGRRGIFHRLGELEPGDVVEVGYADGSTMSFEVLARRQYTKSELPTELLFSRFGEPTLSLVTCAGAWDRRARSYEDNLVVYAAPLR